MKIRQVAALIAALVTCCSIATASTQFVSIDSVHSVGNRTEITSLTPIAENPEDGRILEFRGIHLSYESGGVQRRRPISMSLDFRAMHEEDFEEFSDITSAGDIEGLFDENGLLQITKFVNLSDDENIQASVALQGLESDSYEQINKTILSLGVESNEELSTVIVTDDPVPILIPAIVGIVALTVTHYLNCSNHMTTTTVTFLPKLWGGIEIKSECG